MDTVYISLLCVICAGIGVMIGFAINEYVTVNGYDDTDIADENYYDQIEHDKNKYHEGYNSGYKRGFRNGYEKSFEIHFLKHERRKE